MRLPRVRFTVRRIMLAVAVAAVVMGIEINVASYARCIVSDLGDGQDYIASEAAMVWIVAQIPLSLALAVTFAVFRLSRRRSCPNPNSASDEL